MPNNHQQGICFGFQHGGDVAGANRPSIELIALGTKVALVANVGTDVPRLVGIRSVGRTRPVSIGLQILDRADIVLTSGRAIAKNAKIR